MIQGREELQNVGEQKYYVLSLYDCKKLKHADLYDQQMMSTPERTAWRPGWFSSLPVKSGTLISTPEI